MKVQDLDFPYPERLVATERAPSSRVMMVVGDQPREIGETSVGGIEALVQELNAGDVLVINDTRVLKRRIFSESGLEILFLKPVGERDWEVLCPSSRWKNGVFQTLPGGVTLEILSRGRPQTVRASQILTEAYFQEHGDLPLPPYIQKARGERKNRGADENQYQTAWAEAPGSLAAPTASLHFSDTHLKAIEARGAKIARLTLHVGLGTFLPITSESLDDHQMHAEPVEIPAKTMQMIETAKTAGGRVWALGTTVTRALESALHGKLERDPREAGAFFGETDIFIRPGFKFRAVDVLCTNFHQPQSTLLALVAAFAGLENVRRAYQWAIEREFRLFSYGDLSVWIPR